MALNFPDSPSVGDTYNDTNSGFVYEWDGTIWKSLYGAVDADISADSTPQLGGDLDLNSKDITGTGNINITGIVTATSFVKTSGTSSQFLKADGSVDSSTYIISSDNITGTSGGLSGSPSITVTDINASGDVTITSTDAGSSAGPELTLYRNGASPAPGDYLGQLMFKGENSNGGEENYAKITGKISDETLGTEDGLIETAVKGDGSFVIVSRQKSNELQLINGVGLSVDGTISGNLTGDVTGNITGVAATFSGDVSIGGTLTYEDVTNVDSVGLVTARTGVRVTTGGIEVSAGGAAITGVVTATSVSVAGGHITLNNTGANIIGVTTATSFVKSSGTSSQFLKADGSVDSSTYITSADGGNAATLDSLDSTQFLRSDAADTKTSGDLTFNDSIKANFGTGSDLQIYHNGSHSYIADEGSGELIISGNRIQLMNAARSEKAIDFVQDGAVDIYYNNSKKLETTSSGVTVTGTVAATAFSGDGSALTNLPASGGSADFVASGTISNGDTVVINSNGTVSTISGSGTLTPTAGTPAVFEYATVRFTSATFDSNSNKVVIVYSDQGNSNSGTAVVGTVSGSSISFGTPVVFHSGRADNVSVTFDSNSNKVVIFYWDVANSPYPGKAIVGTVSGTSISFGSAVTFDGYVRWISSTFDTNSNKVVAAYRDEQNSNYGTAVVGTVSGNSISFGTPVVFESANTNYNAIAFDSSTNKIVIAYRDDGNSNKATAIVGTVSGTNISFGTATPITGGAGEYFSATFDSSNNKVIVVYRDLTITGRGTAVVGTVSGTSISFGSVNEFYSNITEPVVMYDSVNDRVVIAYRNQDSSSHGTFVDGVVSGTSITFGSPTTFESASISLLSIAYDSNNGKSVVAYKDQGNSDYGTSAVLSPSTFSTNLTEGNYIGIAAGAISSGSTGTINILGGINESQSGLTVGKRYYVNPTNGNLDLEPAAAEGTPGVPIVVAGTSISATKILVR